MEPIRFTNLTGGIEIGANCYLLEASGRRIVLDAGYHPKKSGSDGLPRLDLLKDGSVDAFVLSHAHHDHVGSLPVAMRRQPGAPVFMTEATRRVADIMLHNSVNVMLAESAAGAEGGVLFSHREVDHCARRWAALPLHQRFDLDGERVGATSEADVTVEFWDAGHILGSAGTLLRCGGRTVFYAGDVHFDDQTLCRAAQFPDFAAAPCDVMIMECTYGGREAPPGYTRAAEIERFGRAIDEVFARGGCVLVPLFALGKTQEILAVLHELRRSGRRRRDCPIYIGGLSAKITEVYDQLAHRSVRLCPDLDLLNDIQPFVISGRNVEDVRIRPGRIFALSSGMMMENTLSNIVARQFLSRPECAILFVGYTDPESAGGRLRAAGTGGEVSLGPDHSAEKVRCRVESFHFSAHATRESIRAYLNRVKPRKIVFVHGDAPAVEWFAATVRGDLPGTEVVTPAPGVAVEL